MNELISLKKISKITNGHLIGLNLKIKNFSINSKKIKDHCIFIAINGKIFDGHNFINNAISNGAIALLVNKFVRINNIPQIIVENTILALGKISLWKRKKFKYNVIGITGSTGKTSVKEMTVSILKKKYNTIFTFHNMNNHIGVPLTLLKLYNKYRCAIIEIGGNKINDIKYLGNLVQPNIAIINNISESHIEGFKSLKNIIREKSSIFNYLKEDGIAIFNSDDKNQKEIFKKISISKKFFTFSVYNKNTNFFASNIKIFQDKILFNLNTPLGVRIVTLFLFGGIHNISNALASSALSFAMGASLDEIVNGLECFKPIQGRIYPIKIGDKKLILNDAYNANPNSVKVAIKVLQNFSGVKILVIGTMLELGTRTIFFHKKVRDIILQSNINYTFSIGNYGKYITQNNKKAKHFNSKEDLINNLFSLIMRLDNYTILFKGSRKNNMEMLINILLEKIQ
ncbi:UDP-N-acetylmuramoyl-tripeptide--D-alanyl-D-alanine ligase [Enterobacteriaceae endosymbiont of Donacia tomentosa]|uniref:UDP-N-acetylmuramoyl-tripeptide--D-alanyl-D- alanine ligase n=1 Tax=Enterobacteriaceae endosymbiont of Donacia tomentosa TaxID=2675787 RepID=UPI0014498F78|nr:UDP-N-acetylmuramoyl-tripeptide--D-alanyl-D-alanine ligase [Enterobacteriaceae endosymbiont of Donacia tomentosa]QJC31586.1 UDP-N-acetylmuramoyl-tripeptide--D-alanyl-D-alanine ligase [Enterobacteriaceae endosymbiont of Donacia tomentosa]